MGDRELTIQRLSVALLEARSAHADILQHLQVLGLKGSLQPLTSRLLPAVLHICEAAGCAVTTLGLLPCRASFPCFHPL